MKFYSKRAYKEAIQRSQDPNQFEDYRLGFNYEGDSISLAWEKYPDEDSGGRSQICEGGRDKEAILAHEEFHQLKLDEFTIKLTSLLKEYNISMSFGCGCCGGGMNCGDLELSLTNEELGGINQDE